MKLKNILLVGLIFCITTSLHAEEKGFTYYVDDIDNKAVITGYMGNSDYVEVPEEIDGHQVKRLEPLTEYPIFNRDTKGIVLPNRGVTVSQNAFSKYIGISYKSNEVIENVGLSVTRKELSIEDTEESETQSEEEASAKLEMLLEGQDVDLMSLAEELNLIGETSGNIENSTNKETYIIDIKSEEQTKTKKKVVKKVNTIIESIEVPQWVIICTLIILGLIVVLIIILIALQVYKVTQQPKRRNAGNITRRR